MLKPLNNIILAALSIMLNFYINLLTWKLNVLIAIMYILLKW